MKIFYRYLVWLVIGLMVVVTPGCGGCYSDGETDAEKAAAAKKKKEEEKKKQEKKPNYQSAGTAIMPGRSPSLTVPTKKQIAEMTPLERQQMEARRFTRRNRVKPGHWLTTLTPLVANNFNQNGRLVTRRAGNANGAALIPGTEYWLATSRGVSLPKGEWKYLESSVYIPPKRVNELSVNLDVRLTTESGVDLYRIPVSFSSTMKSFQYHIVTLTSRNERMNYLKLADSIAVKNPDSFQVEDVPPFYYIVDTQPEQPVPLPRNFLNWTTIAYVIWDDFNPNDLELDQQQAMIDWLHFGGQLIISAPDCLAQLESSFLADYLPAQSAGKIKIPTQAIEPLNQSWTPVGGKTSKETRHLLATENSPLFGVEFSPHVDAQFIDGTGSLCIERSIGRGRIVATAFSLASSKVKSWPSFQGFFNGALLRRPGRTFGWNNEELLTFRWDQMESSIFDPLLGSNVRLISRDLALGGTPPAPDLSGVSLPTDEYLFDQTVATNRKFELRHGAADRSLDKFPGYYGGFAANKISGVGGWNDSGAVADAARDILKSAAGITPPSARLVLKMLAIYLVILVPINWLFFRTIGKIEWAWATVPLIAIAGAIAVVKLAALDIGFARSNTQTGVLELYAGHSRGHLTQYSALYTSLSTSYDIELDNPTGIAMPFPTGTAAGPPTGVSAKPITLDQSVSSRLEDLQIQSNSTRLVHAEWMQEIDGLFRLNTGRSAVAASPPTGSSDRVDTFELPFSIRNSSIIDLQSAAVVGRDRNGRYFRCWVGDIDSNSRAEQLEFEPIEQPQVQQTWDDQIAGDTFVKPVLDVVVEYLELGLGEIRLVGITDQTIGGTQVVPRSTQTTQQTVVVVHLQSAILPTPQRDGNSLQDFISGRSNLDFDLQSDENLNAQPTTN